jgi:hypothetical protein
VGRKAAWQRDKITTLTDPTLTDHANDTVLLIEDASGIGWTEPRDFSLDDLGKNMASAGSKPIVSCRHIRDNGYFYHETPAGANVVFANGRVQYLFACCFTSRNLARLLVVGGCTEEAIASCFQGYSEEAPHFHWPHCIALAVLLASSACLLIQAMGRRKSPPASAVE